ncbi:dsDNA nuclease domain-containing protein [Burkholderia sp. Z1]|uniref:dsDNA nuclease domain-containing protein n=1 Tax=Burkholderia sp. Z1 TaxID=2759039 RepID=UPI001D012057|nr:dsDNA nuclease domain-containing protein [Burkholderia sp. Z1]
MSTAPADMNLKGRGEQGQPRSQSATWESLGITAPASKTKILYIYTVMESHPVIFSTALRLHWWRGYMVGVSPFILPPRRHGKRDGAARANLLKIARTVVRGMREENMDIIHDKAPRETVGRETTNRFRMQFQAAAFAALEILSGKDVDRVYCDYHDDFVVRRNVGGSIEYHFFQVKTKGRANQQWKVDEVFSLKKREKLDTQEKLAAVRNSIAGKLLVHTIEFGEQCRGATVLSNVHFQDDVFEVREGLMVGKSNRAYVTQLIDKFCEIFSPSNPLSDDELKAAKSKLTFLQVSYLGETLEPFADAARNAIWKHSEIDLHKHEVDEIANSLVNLVESKSCAPIGGLTKEQIEIIAGIGLGDLLKVLSISTEVYKNLLDGGDPAAIKAASILQRQLKTAGAPESMIETASRAKVSWDVWLRTARHTFPEFDLGLLLEDIDTKCKAWILSGSALGDLRKQVEEVLRSDLAKKFPPLDIDLLLGGFCASIVRRASR